MRNTIYILLLSLIYSAAVNAQSAKLEFNQVLYNNIIRSSIELNMDVPIKEVKKAWKDYVEDKFDVDVDGYGLFNKDDILTANRVNIKAISSRTIDFYAKIVEDDGMTKMSVFGALDFETFFTPTDHPVQFQGMNNVVGNFVASFLPNYFAEVVEDTQDDVKDAADNVAYLEKKIEKNKKKINDLTKENIDLVAELAKSREILSKSRATLSTDKEKLETVKDKVSKSGS